MTKTRRRVLFYALVLLFLLGGTAIVLYAQGWRLDLAHRRITQVGGIYVRSFPPDVKIMLDGRPAEASSRFFDSGFLLNDLFPKAYSLALEKEGYRPWRRTVAVSPAGVAEIRSAVLVPEAAATTAEEVSRFWIAGGAMPLIRTATGTLMLGRAALPGRDVIAADGAGTFFVTRTAGGGRYFWIDASAATSTEITTLMRSAENMLGETPRRFLADEEGAPAIALQGARNLVIADVTARTAILITPPRSRDEITGAAFSDGRVAYAVTGGKPASSTIRLYRQATQRTETIAASIPGKTGEITWIDGDHLAVLQDNGAFYRLDARGKAPESVASDVRLFAFTPDGARVSAVGRSSMEVISTDNKAYWRFNLPDIGAIRKISWYADGQHLFLHYPDRVMFLDLDDTGLENLTLVAETVMGAYDAGTNTFYSIADGQLREIEFPR